MRLSSILLNRPETIFTFSTKYPRANKFIPKGNNVIRSNPRLKLAHPNKVSSKKPIHQNFKQSLEFKEKMSSSLDPRFELQDSKTIRFLAAQSASQNSSPVTSFHKLSLNNSVVQAISSQYDTPTPIQSLAIPTLLQGEDDVYIGSETGSGKTLAYLSALFHHIVSFDQSQKAANQFDPLIHRKLKNPRAFIIVPSRHLVVQVTQMAKLLSHTARLCVVGVHSQMERSTVTDLFLKPVDILVCTPGALEWMIRPPFPKDSISKDLKKGLDLHLGNCQHVVIDECDTIFDSKQVGEIEHLLAPIIKRKQKFKSETNPAPHMKNCQFIMVSATLPVALSNYIDKLFPNLKKITTSYLHKTAPTLKQNFIQVHPSTTKQNILIETLKRNVMKGDKRIIVFVNRTGIIPSLVDELHEKGFNVFGASSFYDRKYQVECMKSFMQPPRYEETPLKSNESELLNSNKNDQISIKLSIKDENVLEKKKSNHKTLEKDSKVTKQVPFSHDIQEPMILVTTDMFSRGMDTKHVSHVILYDFPTTTIDYLHRVGRTARNGTYGACTSIIAKKDKQLAASIEYAIKKKQPLTAR